MSRPVLLYDGLCGFCDGAVQWILEHDRRGELWFATLQGDFGQAVLDGQPELREVDSLILVEGEGGAAGAAGRADGADAAGAGERGAAGVADPADAAGAGDAAGAAGARRRVRIRVRSDAALRVATAMGGAWRLLAAFRVVPRPLRDALYDVFARNRYRWFGRREECRLPSAEERARFLE